MKNKFLVVANWKSYLDSSQSSRLLSKLDGFSDTSHVKHIVCPSLVAVSQQASVLKKWYLGVQDIFWEGQGAYTGEFHIKDLKKLKVKYAIVGHSERRVYLGETDAMVAKKALFALENNVTPIICFGENMAQHKAGKTKSVLRSQLQAIIGNVAEGAKKANIIIAYEPIWAIKGFGTGKKVSQKALAETILFIHNEMEKYTNCNYQLLYGGSVDDELAPKYMKTSIDGFLVGSASTKYASLKNLLQTIYSTF